MNLRSYLLASLVALALVPFTFAQDAVDPAEWAPADAVAFLGVTDIDKTWEDFQKTTIYATMNDPAMKDDKQLGLFGNMVEKIKTRLAKSLGVEASQLKSPFKGAVAFYATSATVDGKSKLQPNLIATVGDSGIAKKYYTAAVEKLKKAADKHETVNAGSNAIDVFTTAPKSEDEEADEDEAAEEETADESSDPLTAGIDSAFDDFLSGKSMPPSIAMCLTNDRLVVAATADLVKDALKREKRGNAMIDSDDYKSGMKAIKASGTVRVLINLPRMLEIARSESEDKETSEKEMRAMGVEGFRSIVAALGFNAGGCEYRLDAIALMKGERTGIPKLLSMENRPTTPPDYVSENTCLYGQINLSIPKLIDEIERMTRQYDPAAADQMHQGLEAAPISGPGTDPINLRKDVIDHMKEPINFTLAIARPIDADSLRLAISLSHKNQEAMNAFLSKVPMITPSDVRGTQVYSSPFDMSAAVLTDRLVIGLPPAVLSSLDKPSGRLADTDGWKAVAKLIPEQTSAFFFAEDRLFHEGVLELAKSKEAMGGGAARAGLAQMLISQSVGPDAKEEDIERHRKVLKYAGRSIMTMTTTNEGIQLLGLYLKIDSK